MVILDFKTLQILPSSGYVAVYYNYSNGEVSQVYSEPVVLWALCECLNEAKDNVDDPNTNSVHGMSLFDGYLMDSELDHTFLGYCKKEDFHLPEWESAARSSYKLWCRGLDEYK